MALRDQPYLPLYIQDIMTDEKLNECCAATHGIYIKGIMCLMHKSETYGRILLKQKYKQNSSMCLNFAYQLSKHLPYSVDEIHFAISELIKEQVCYFEDDYLCQKRMIRDNDISEARSKAGKKGGGNPNFVSSFVKTKLQTNSEYEYEYEYKDESSLEKEESAERGKNEIDYTGILDYWNLNCGAYFPTLKTLSKSRKDKLKLRITEMGDVDILKQVFVKMTESNFLKGEGGSWKASFDWIVSNDKNWLKVLEGNYDNKKEDHGKNKRGTGATSDEQLLSSIEQGINRAMQQRN